MKNEKTFTVNIYTPQSLFLSEDAEALVCTSLDGQLGILKNHMPAVIALDCGVLELKHGEIRTSYVTSEGFLEVYGNTVSVYVNRCHQEDDAALARAEADSLRRRERQSVAEHRHNEVHLARIIADSRRGKLH